MSSIVEYYGACFASHGDTALGAGWPNEPDRLIRFDVMLDIVQMMVPDGPIVLADIGCGTGELLRRIRERRMDRMTYVGADALDGPLSQARSKFPGTPFYRMDVAAAEADDLARLSCDVLLANGLFTVKRSLSHEEMWDFMTGVIGRFWPFVRQGVVFNVMSKAVDHERDDLFHVSFDRLATFLHALAGRTIGFRADYGLFEYMAYAMKTPRTDAPSGR